MEKENFGIKSIKPFKRNNYWAFELNGQTYDTAPADAMCLFLSPLIVGIDKIVSSICLLKELESEKELNLLFSENYFPNADLKLNFKEQKLDGTVYSVEELNVKNVFVPGQCAWICSYISLYFSSIPQAIYLKIEKNQQA